MAYQRLNTVKYKSITRLLGFNTDRVRRNYTEVVVPLGHCFTQFLKQI